MMELVEFVREHSSVIIPIVGLLGSALAIILFIKAGKRNKINDQKKTIVPLISDIQTNIIEIEFGNWTPNKDGGGGGSGTSHNLNLFQIGDLVDGQFQYSKYDSEPIYFAKKSNKILDLKKHISNPLMPIEIIKALEKFENDYFDKIQYKEIKSRVEFVKISTELFDENYMNILEKDTPFKLGNGTAYMSFMSFKACIKELEKEIQNWNKRNNMGLQVRSDISKFN